MTYRMFEEKEIPLPEEEPVFEEQTTEATESTKVKNLTSAVILLVGLFVGSIFVDVAQLVSREGFSPMAVKKSNILEAGGKTWVAYADPKVKVTVLSDATCEQCKPDQALVWLHRILPTMEASPVEASSDQGKALVEKMGVTTLPAFVFDGEVKGTDFFGLAGQIFTEKDGQYLLNTTQLGLEPGKYLKLPEVGEGAITIGNKDAKVRVVEFSDFQCPYCKAFHPAIKQMLSEYKDKVLFVYKHLPLSFHPQAQNAALSSECANEQGKFAEYADILYTNQADWGKTGGTQSFKTYARQLGLKADQFNKCVDDKKYEDKIAADAAEAASFGVNGTPGTFVGDTFVGGAESYEALKKTLDEKLQ
jgi:protein-disulfide isomerase